MAAGETESDTVPDGGHESKSHDTNDSVAEKSPPGTGKNPPAGDATGDAAGDAVADPNLVDWDGPSDPANPRNWSQARKMISISLVSLSVLYCNLATTMFAPGANVMAAEFRFHDKTIMVLTITIASVGFAMGPLFVAPLSEVCGRIPIYRTSAIFYLGFTVDCARSTSVAEFLVFRFLTGCAAART